MDAKPDIDHTLLKEVSAHLDAGLVLQRYQALGRSKIIRFQYKDISVALYLPEGHVDLIQKEILRTNNFFESKLLAQLEEVIRPGDVVLDAGANIGNHTVFFAKICHASQVIAFEPQQTRFSILLRNVSLNHLDGVQCFRVGLGSEAGLASVSVFKPWNSGATALRVDPLGTFKIEPLDSFHFPRINIVKIDVEGFQMSLLKGARETLIRTRPRIIIELREDQDDVKNIVEFLRTVGATKARRLTTYEWLYDFPS
jgi:FkbM family methyltransferase